MSDKVSLTVTVSKYTNLTNTTVCIFNDITAQSVDLDWLIQTLERYSVKLMEEVDRLRKQME